jgi:uncharacterized membrane protein
LAYAVLLGSLVVVRLHSGSALWLDEALSVYIARLPVGQLLAALREDGSPPLYSLLLHGWIALFGVGSDAVRALSVLFSLLALPAAYWLGRRLDGRCAARGRGPRRAVQDRRQRNRVEARAGADVHG